MVCVYIWVCVWPIGWWSVQDLQPTRVLGVFLSVWKGASPERATMQEDLRGATAVLDNECGTEAAILLPDARVGTKHGV